MTRKAPRTPQQARAATISLGGDARARPDLQGLIRPLFDAAQQPVIQRHPANPRRGDHDAIVKSIRNNGVYSPIKVQRSTGYVLAGNHTLDAILDQGGTSAPWVWLDVDDAEARRIMLDDNHVGELGGYDDRMLLESLRAAQAAGDLLDTSYVAEDLLSLERSVANLDFVTGIHTDGIPLSDVSGPGRMPYHGPFEDDIMHALEYALHGGPGRTAAVVDVIRYNKEHKARAGGMRTQYNAARGLEIANRYPRNVRIGLGPRTSGTKDSARGVRHFLNTNGFTPVTVTDLPRFTAADTELRAAVQAAIEAKREWDRGKINRRAGRAG